MLLTTNPVQTVRLTPDVVKLLKECDRVSTFKESGWFFAYGWVGDVLKVKSHADSEAEYNSLMNGGYWGFGSRQKG